MTLLARLGVDERFERQGIGRALVAHAIEQTLRAAEIVGSRGLLIHAESPEARDF
jgi:predicted N-acetyltransferase YhbS